jgi:hypothetical protein
MIPPFDRRGNLPPGIHNASWDELEARFGGTPWRNALLQGLQEALESLKRAGCRKAYIDGSFVTAKEVPADFDACWESDGVKLAALDSILLDFTEDRRVQKERFRGELFPADLVTEPEGIPVLEFFQRERIPGLAKGIVQVELGTGL